MCAWMGMAIIDVVPWRYWWANWQAVTVMTKETCSKTAVAVAVAVIHSQMILWDLWILFFLHSLSTLLLLVRIPLLSLWITVHPMMQQLRQYIMHPLHRSDGKLRTLMYTAISTRSLSFTRPYHRSAIHIDY